MLETATGAGSLHTNAARDLHLRAMQVAYLASTLFLDSNSDLIVLIVNTITRDLADDNMLIGVHARPCT